MLRFIQSIILIIFLNFNTFSQEINGVILDDISKTPIQLALITIIDLDISTSSDSLGNFIFTNKLPLSVKLKISAFGFESQIITIESNRKNISVFLIEKHFQLDEVTVSASKSTIQKYNAVHIESRKLQDLNSVSNTTLGEALSSIPGVYQSTTGIGISKPVIRGMQGVRVVTLLNGLRLENQQWGGDHGMGMTDLGIGSVEVIKGPSSLLYGADALGGVLYFIDESFAKQNSFSVGVKTQNESNTMGTSNQLSYKVAKNNVRFNLSGGISSHADYKLSSGYFVKDSRFSENSLKMAFATNKEKWSLNVRYNYSNNTIGIPGESEDSIITPMSFQTNIQERNKILPHQLFQNHFLSVENKWFLKRNEINLLVGQTVNELSEYEENPKEPGLNMILANSLYSFKVKTDVNEYWNIVSGLQGMYQQNNNGAGATEKLLPNSISVDNGIYTIGYFQKNNWGVQVGGRYDLRVIDTKESINGGELYKKNFQSFNFSAGLVRNSKKMTYRINVSSGFRAPHLSELLADGIHHGAYRYEIGNRNLLSEKATQIDLTVERHGEHLELIVNPFYNYIQNYIYLQSTDSVIENFPVYQYQQLNSVHLFGTDIGFHYHPHFAHWLHIESTVSFLQAETFVKDQNISLMPQNRLNTYFRVEFESKHKFKLEEFTIQHTYFSKQDRVSEYETKSPSYQLFNTALNFKYGNKNPLYINLGVKNVFNVQYVDHLSRLKNIGLFQPGRNIYVILKYTINNKMK